MLLTGDCKRYFLGTFLIVRRWLVVCKDFLTLPSQSTSWQHEGDYVVCPSASMQARAMTRTPCKPVAWYLWVGEGRRQRIPAVPFFPLVRPAALGLGPALVAAEQVLPLLLHAPDGLLHNTHTQSSSVVDSGSGT